MLKMRLALIANAFAVLIYSKRKQSRNSAILARRRIKKVMAGSEYFLGEDQILLPLPRGNDKKGVPWRFVY
jgi:hypothetical protein